MSTLLLDVFEQLDDKWAEVDLLLEEAVRLEDERPQLSNAICRSVTVLIVAHLEGFIKDLAKAVVFDMNSANNFASLPNSVQRSYCVKYIGEASDDKQGYERKVCALIDKFSILNSSISYEPFLYADNKNPKPSIIKNVFKNFGVKDVFRNLNGSLLDDAFEMSMPSLIQKLDESKQAISIGLQEFPYDFDLSRLDLEPSSGRVRQRTLWQEFLDDINYKRHEVAHGNAFRNMESASILKFTKNKVQYLQLGLIELLAGHIVKTMNID